MTTADTTFSFDGLQPGDMIELGGDDLQARLRVLHVNPGDAMVAAHNLDSHGPEQDTAHAKLVNLLGTDTANMNDPFAPVFAPYAFVVAPNHHLVYRPCGDGSTIGQRHVDSIRIRRGETVVFEATAEYSLA